MPNIQCLISITCAKALRKAFISKMWLFDLVTHDLWLNESCYEASSSRPTLFWRQKYGCKCVTYIRLWCFTFYVKEIGAVNKPQAVLGQCNLTYSTKRSFVHSFIMIINRKCWFLIPVQCTNTYSVFTGTLLIMTSSTTFIKTLPCFLFPGKTPGQGHEDDKKGSTS